MVKIEDSLPWIELKGVFQTRSEAQNAAKEKLSKTKIKIVKMSPRKKTLKMALAASP
ncbi:MAG: hypothetical protein NWE94_08595 [Candidatus Bathyarchaeota archaeon]|nr:hypothetical protein [Candidatus Bathyarchaeota archaeon]